MEVKSSRARRAPATLITERWQKITSNITLKDKRHKEWISDVVDVYIVKLLYLYIVIFGWEGRKPKYIL